jgi:hypothetical protein
MKHQKKRQEKLEARRKAHDLITRDNRVSQKQRSTHRKPGSMNQHKQR